MYKFLKVTQISELKSNQEGLKYYVVSFRPCNILPSGLEVFSNQKEKTRVVFSDKDDSKGDPLFLEIMTKKLTVGSLVEGAIHIFNTTPYKPEGFDNPVTSYSCVCFSGENPVKQANRQLKNNEACVVDETGNITAPDQLNSKVDTVVVPFNQ